MFPFTCTCMSVRFLNFISNYWQRTETFWRRSILSHINSIQIKIIQQYGNIRIYCGFKSRKRQYSSFKYMDRVKRIWYLPPMRATKVQASLRIRAVSPEPSLLAHTSSESRGTFRQKARSLAPLNGWACAVNICHDGMLEDTNSLDAAHIINSAIRTLLTFSHQFWKRLIIEKTYCDSFLLYP